MKATAVYTTKVSYNWEWEEYTVKLFEDGKHVKAADYFTDDREDANATARAMLTVWFPPVSAHENGKNEITPRREYWEATIQDDILRDHRYLHIYSTLDIARSIAAGRVREGETLVGILRVPESTLPRDIADDALHPDLYIREAYDEYQTLHDAGVSRAIDRMRDGMDNNGAPYNEGEIKVRSEEILMAASEAREENSRVFRADVDNPTWDNLMKWKKLAEDARASA